MYVLDASVAVKWFRADEPDLDAADAVLDAVRSNPKRFWVPEMFFVEMLSALARVPLVPPADLLRDLGTLQDLGIQRVRHDRQVIAGAAALVRSHGITSYDAIYCATAQLIGGAWLTADRRALEKLPAGCDFALDLQAWHARP